MIRWELVAPAPHSWIRRRAEATVDGTTVAGAPIVSTIFPDPRTLTDRMLEWRLWKLPVATGSNTSITYLPPHAAAAARHGVVS